MPTNFIFLHGGGQGSWVWNETLDAIKTQGGTSIGRLLALDIPGCGEKHGEATEDMSVTDIVATLLNDIDASGIEDSLLIGHSQAGTILPRLIKERPNLFKHIIYVSCLAPTGNQNALNWRTEMPDANSAVLNKYPHGSRDFYRLMFCNDMQPEAAEAFLDKLGLDQWPASSYQMSDWDYSPLASYASTYIICMRDAALLPVWQEMFAERLKAKEIIHIDTGHQVMNTRPHELAELILASIN